MSITFASAAQIVRVVVASRPHQKPEQIKEVAECLGVGWKLATRLVEACAYQNDPVVAVLQAERAGSFPSDPDHG